MELVDRHEFRSVAFPIIGAGSGGMNQSRALNFMLDEFRSIKSAAAVMVVQFRR
jgi:O-acetyl-ADP-ribose deacetylase (regulator of RNase III)